MRLCGSALSVRLGLRPFYRLCALDDGESDVYMTSTYDDDWALFVDVTNVPEPEELRRVCNMRGKNMFYDKPKYDATGLQESYIEKRLFC